MTNLEKEFHIIKKDNRSRFERLLDNLLKMIPDSYDRKEYRKGSKKTLIQVESVLSLIEHSTRQLEELKKGLVKENECDSQGRYVSSEEQLSRSLQGYEYDLPLFVSYFKTEFEYLIDGIKEEIRTTEEVFERELFSKFPRKEND